MRLNNFQAFVHQRGRIDRDAATHPPDGVFQCQLWSDRAESPLRGLQEWASRRRQNQPPHFVPVTGTQALMDRAMLAVDREYVHSPGAGRLHHELSRRDQRFFVRQSHRFSGADRLIGGHKARHAM